MRIEKLASLNKKRRGKNIKVGLNKDEEKTFSNYSYAEKTGSNGRKYTMGKHFEKCPRQGHTEDRAGEAALVDVRKHFTWIERESAAEKREHQPASKSLN